MTGSWSSRLMFLHGLLRRQREALGLSQQALADRLSVEVLTVKRWEGGHSDPSATSLFRWADALGISLRVDVGGGIETDTSEAA